MITYWRTSPGMPKLEWGKLIPSPAEVDEFRKPHPRALPGHCKPFVDAQSAGLIIRWPWPETVRITQGADRKIVCTPDHAKVRAFAEGHWSFNSGYSFKTEKGVGLYTSMLPDGFTNLVRVRRGLVETEWYRQPLFFVFENPFMGFEVTIKYGDPLLMVVPVVLPKDLREMTLDEERQATKEIDGYLKMRSMRTDLLWTSAQGQGFSRLYKECSRRIRVWGKR